MFSHRDADVTVPEAAASAQRGAERRTRQEDDVGRPTGTSRTPGERGETALLPPAEGAHCGDEGSQAGEGEEEERDVHRGRRESDGDGRSEEQRRSVTSVSAASRDRPESAAAPCRPAEENGAEEPSERQGLLTDRQPTSDLTRSQRKAPEELWNSSLKYPPTFLTTGSQVA